jgi:uncharacterized protein YdeI (BOF family)
MKALALTALSACLAATAALATQFTPIAEVQRGQMVSVAGIVERITDEDEFRLTDPTGSIRIYVGPNWVPADPGEQVSVSGFVDDDLLGPLEIYARSLIRADGTVITFDHQYD